MRLVIDAHDYANVSGYRWNYKIGYLGLWTQAEIDDARARGELLALVDRGALAPGTAEIIEWAPGAVQNPFTLQTWVRARNETHADAVVRCSLADLQHVIGVLSTDYFRVWVIDDAPSGEPPMTPPDLSLPRTVTLLGVSYVEPPRSGGPYNMSVFYDDSWHSPEDLGAAPPSQMENPTAPGSSSPGSEPGSGSLVETEPAAAAAEVDPTNPFPGIPVGFPPADGPVESPVSSPLPPRPVAASALSTSSAIASAPSSPDTPSSAAQPSGPVTTGVRLDPATSTMSAGPPPLQVMQIPVKPDTPANGPGSVQSPKAKLDHGWISSVMREALDVADALAAAGAPAAAHVLTQAATHGLEIGKLLQLAGL